ncbi:hypothetical protein GF362_04900 [Candidatus Dojkabacteria bacterium]|nr:hypothetical protein [Candidatus Dojkabacteria bacterium]
MQRKRLQNLIGSFEVFLLVFILIFIPLIVNFNFFRAYELPKIFIFRVCVSLLTIVVLLHHMFFLKTYQNTKKIKLNRESAIILIGIFLIIIWLTITTLLSDNIITSIWGNYDKRFGLLTIMNLIFFGLLSFDILQRNLQKFLFLFSVCIPVFILINFKDSYEQLFLGTLDLNLTEGRVVGTFGQSNFLAGYVLLMMPFLLYFLYSIKSKLFKTYIVMNIVVSIILVWWSGSRMGQIILIFLLIYSLALFIKHYFTQPILKKFALAISIILGIMVILIVFTTSSRFQAFGLLDDTRRNIWKASLQAISDSPLIGYGLDVGGYILPAYMYQSGVNVPISLDRAHNEFLDISLNTGLIGLVFVSCFALYLYYKFLTLFKGMEAKKKILFIVLLSTILIFWVRSMVNVNGIMHYVFYVFVSAFIALEISKQNVQTIELKIGNKYFNTFCKFLIVFSFGIFSVYNFIVSFNAVKADILFNNYFYKTRAVNDIEQTVNYAPNQIIYRLELLNAYLANDISFEIREVLPARFLEQNRYWARYYADVGAYYESRGDLEKAGEYYKKAIKFEPINKSYNEKLDNIIQN